MQKMLAALICVASSLAAQAMESVPKAEYHARRMALAEKLHGGAAVLFAAEEPVLDFMPYRQDSDFFYLTGWTEPGAALVVIGAGPETVVPRSGERVPAHTYREILFLPSRNLVIENVHGREDGRFHGRGCNPGGSGRGAAAERDASRRREVCSGRSATRANALDADRHAGGYSCCEFSWSEPGAGHNRDPRAGCSRADDGSANREEPGRAGAVEEGE